MNWNTLLALLLTAPLGLAHAETQVERIDYQIDGQPYQGLLVYDDAVTTPRPGLLMVPNWLGVTDRSAEKAARAASDKYVVFVADLYGKDVRPKGPEEAGKVVGPLRADRPLMRQRAQASLDELLKHRDKVNTQQVGAIGFCFGGGAILELARSGAPLSAFVSFHGNLDTPNPADNGNIKGSVLVLHGADDPAVPKQQVDGFVAAMQATDVDWQLVSYGNAVHSFTDPYANVPGRNEYHPLVAERAFKAMNDLLDQAFAP
ncbi:MAG TPA: dienelactone hydrolase family protein [Pseudomonas sp.]|jgi:dienelactone hydrolase|nr:dienelactone hydrolase family protein [Pseudomonas sp.]